MLQATPPYSLVIAWRVQEEQTLALTLTYLETGVVLLLRLQELAQGELIEYEAAQEAEGHHAAFKLVDETDGHLHSNSDTSRGINHGKRLARLATKALVRNG